MFLFSYLLFLSVLNLMSLCSCWQYFVPMHEINMFNSPLEDVIIHSEYLYGECRDPSKIFYNHVHLDHMEVIGKIIIRGWIDIMRIPTCIIIRAIAHEEDQFRNTAYNFQICVPRITYIHAGKRHKYFFYEWYLPYDMVGGMNWDLYFFGPADLFWQ